MRFPPKSLAWTATTITLAALFTWPACYGQGEPAAGYLSDTLARHIASSTQSWGNLGFDTAVQPPGRPAAALRIQERSYRKGLGHHAAGEIIVDLDGQFESFLADVGIQWQGGGTAGSVVFRVFVDDRKVFDSGVVREADPPRGVRVPVVDAQELRLVVTDAGDGITCDCANWADARLTRNPRAKPSAALSVNVVPFGRIMSWDPAKKTGTSATRVDEFPAADIEPGRELVADAGGNIPVPDWNGRGCVGVQWYENRTFRRLELEFADAAHVPSWETVEPEIWIGESVWQGRWEPLKARRTREANRLILLLEGPEARHATPRIRWLFSGSGDRPRALRSIAAFTSSRWKTVDLEIASLDGRSLAQLPVELYNGVFSRLDRKSEGPISARVLTSVSRGDKTDRTVLRFKDSEPGFGIAVEDVLEHGSVSFGGIRVSSGNAQPRDAAAAPTTLPVLSDVKKRPDQTLERALAVVHNPVQNLGPMMLSLACDNRKLVADRNGTVHFDLYEGVDDPPRPIPDQWRLEVRTGTSGAVADNADAKIERRLQHDWLPAPELTTRDGSVVYRQTTFVAPVGEAKPEVPGWVRDRAVGLVEFRIKNAGEAKAGARLGLAIRGKENAALEITSRAGVHRVSRGGRTLALIDARGAAPLEVALDREGASLAGPLEPGKEARCAVLIPLWKTAPSDETAITAVAAWLPPTEAYWSKLLEDSMRVDLPDAFLSNLIRASQVHCFLAARSEAGGRRVAPWISSDRYGPLESEANAVIRGMDLLGQTEFARRSLEFFIEHYDPRGFLTTGYTLVGTGEHLWTLAEYHDRTRDRAWLERIAPKLVRVCDWIVAQRGKTKRLDAQGRRVPEYGLTPPGVTADWNRFAYRYFNDAQYCAGLMGAARALAGIGHARASALEEEARQYRNELLASYHWAQARAPVVPLGDGTWGLSQPALLGSFGGVEEFLPGEDGNRSWVYSVEVGAHHLAALGILDPASAEVSDMLEYLEGFQYLRSGMGDYPAETSRKDPFNLGGFAKIQPYYARVPEVYAQRDDVKPFVRAYFNGLASLVSLENLSFWEHFHNQGGWNKTHETGWFLCQTRLMLVQERGADLWLAPMVTDQWLKEGKVISIRNAPTRFGKVGYTIRPAAGGTSIDAEVLPPPSVSEGLRRIVIRVRHPEGKPIRAVTVAGRAHSDYDAKAQTVSLPPSTTPISVHVEY